MTTPKPPLDSSPSAQADEVVGHKTFHDGRGGFRHEPLMRAEANEILARCDAEKAQRLELMPDMSAQASGLTREYVKKLLEAANFVGMDAVQIWQWQLRTLCEHYLLSTPAVAPAVPSPGVVDYPYYTIPSPGETK